jgi:hypothetical protein
MSYLEKKIPDLFEEQKASMAKGERPDPKTKKLWQDCMKRKGEITVKCESGEMTPEQYVEGLKKQVAKDTKLIEYFTKTKDVAKLKIVQERQAIVKAELAEMS